MTIPKAAAGRAEGDRNGPQVTVILLTFHRPASLARCLLSLSRQSLDREAFEVLVVDASPPLADPVIEQFRESLPLRHLRISNRGVAGNRNAGAQHASAPFLAFIDDDCVADTGWLAALLGACQRHEACLVGGKTINLLPDNTIAIAGQLITDAVHQHHNHHPENARFVPGLNYALPRYLFLEQGGNDERFGRLAAEDRHFCVRWLQAGRRIISIDDAIVGHEHRASLRGYLRQYFNYGRGAWRMQSLLRDTLPSRRTDPDGSGDRIWTNHLALVREIARAWRRTPPKNPAAMLLLLVAWELANLTGFLWEGLTEPRPGGRAAVTDRSLPPLQRR